MGSTNARSTGGPASSTGSRAGSCPASTWRPAGCGPTAHSTTSRGLMHGDYQIANVMFRHGGPARLAAIVDWEMGTVGDPKLDMAWMVQSWPGDTASPATAFPGHADLSGMPSRSALLARYAEVSGRQVDDIDY
ncbi:MAG TPA: phosphotransferase [Streptosporangiaceae bacterium]|nr:phosphotransferase [Streptosporangiaceae bacterium]